MSTPNNDCASVGIASFSLNATEAQFLGPNASQSGSRVRNDSGFAASATTRKTMASRPNTPPAAINPEENSAPGLASLSSFFLVVTSTSQRINPPANIAPVVAMERYDPVAKASDLTPSISTATTSATPISTSRHGNR